MHVFVSYRRFGRTQSLRSDRAGRAHRRYVATVRPFSGFSPMSHVSSAELFVRINLFRKSIYRRKKFLLSSLDVLNVNFVATVFDPNS